MVASVSCIYGLGSPDEYRNMHLFLKEKEEYPREEIQRRLVYMLYERNDISFHRGTFRVRGDVVEIYPSYEHDRALRVEWFGDEVEAIYWIDPLRGRTLRRLPKIRIHPGSHYVTEAGRLVSAIETIKAELGRHLRDLEAQGKLKIRCNYRCLSACKVEKANFCIADALLNSYLGDVDNGLIFSGNTSYRINEIVPVKELMDELRAGIIQADTALPAAGK